MSWIETLKISYQVNIICLPLHHLHVSKLKYSKQKEVIVSCKWVFACEISLWLRYSRNINKMWNYVCFLN